VPLLLVALFVVVPLAELYLIVQVAQAIDILPTLGILLLDSIVGSLLLRSQGRAVWRRFNEALGSARVPHREILDGVLMIFGGALLLTPGFLTDVVGLLLLIPPSRAVVRGLATRMLARRVAVGVAGAGRSAPGPESAPGGRTGGAARSRAARAGDVEGTATERGTEDAAAREAPPRLER